MKIARIALAAVLLGVCHPASAQFNTPFNNNPVRPGGAVDSSTVLGRTLAGRFSERLNILDYAPAGTSVDQTGAVDASAALSAVVTAANAKTYYSATHPVQPVCIYIPAGKYKISSPPPAFQGPGCVVGDGPNQSVIQLDVSFTGDLFAWSEAWTVYDRFGPAVRELKVIGAGTGSAGPQNALMFYDRNDYVLLENIGLYDINGRAIGSGMLKNTATAAQQSYLREAHWRNIRVWRSGTSSVPAVDLAVNGVRNPNGAFDGTNELRVSNLDIYGSYGKSLSITSPAEGGIRQMAFDGLRIEGRQTQIGVSTGDLLTIGSSTDLGLINIIQFSNMELINPGLNTCALRIAGGNSTTLPVSNIVARGWIGGAATGGTGLCISNAKNLQMSFTDIATSGPKVQVGPGVVNVSLDGGGAETAWTYSIDPASATAINIPLRRIGNPSAVGAGSGTTSIPGTLSTDAFSVTNFSAGQITAGGVQVGAAGLTVAGGSVTACPIFFGANVASRGAFAGTVPTLTVAPPQTGGAQAACVVATMGYHSVQPSGSALTGAGCSVNDVLTVQGGTIASGVATQLRVTSVDGAGKPTAFASQSTAGLYSILPPMSATLSGGTCTTSPTANVAYGVNTATVSAAGSGYATPPAITGPAVNAATGVYVALQGQTATVDTALPISASLGAVQLDGSGTTLGVAGATGAPVITRGALVDRSGVRQALTGAAYTVPQNTSLVRFIQTGTIASQTVTLPTAFADGQPVQFVNYAGPVTALTLSPAVNGWTNGSTLAANTGMRIRWDATSAAWYREQ